MLAHFTEQGIKNVKDSLGAIIEAPDDLTMTAVGLSLGTLGNVRTQTLRAFDEAEMKTILGKIG